MKKSLLSLLAFLFAIGTFMNGCCTYCSSKGSRSVELFDGKSLEGWNYVLADASVKKEDVWSVKDGILTCKGTPLGALYRGPEVRSFRLIVEYRWAPGEKPGNSGIFSRIHGPIKALPPCVEVQLQHGNAGDVLGLHGTRVVGGQPRFFEVKNHAVAGDIAGVKKLRDAEKPAGEWNRVEITANVDVYRVEINGKLVNEVPGVEQFAGPIGLQSEGGVIQFRRVTLTSMD